MSTMTIPTTTSTAGSSARFPVSSRLGGIGGLIAVGGALTPQWKALALPTMHVMTFSMQTAVVDQFVVSGAGTPKSVVLDTDALARSAQLGRNVATQMGRSFDDAEYVGEPGLCPLCHLDVIELRGRAVSCATCGAAGRLAEQHRREVGAGADRLRQEEPRQAHQCVVEQRLAGPRRRRAVQVHERHGYRPRSLPRRRGGDHGKRSISGIPATPVWAGSARRRAR